LISPAGPDASPLARLLGGLTATLELETDVASDRLYRIARVPRAMQHTVGQAANRWAKTAAWATVQAGEALALVQAVERRESEWFAGRSRYKVVG
jgi:hypothetical protein